MIFKFHTKQLPEFISFLNVPTSKYDFEVSREHISIITEEYVSIYMLDLPLRFGGQIILKQKLTHKFTLKEYD